MARILSLEEKKSGNCRECWRVLKKSWNFCPYCGTCAKQVPGLGDDGAKPSSKRIFTGARHSGTEPSQEVLTYWEKDIEMCTVSGPVQPDAQVRLAGFDRELLHRNYDRDITLFPGVHRNVENADGSLCGYYEFLSLGCFHLVCGEVFLKVYTNENGWEIYANRDKMLVAMITKEQDRKQISGADSGEESQPTKAGEQSEDRYSVFLDTVLPPELQAMILGIPVLGF